MDWISKVLDIKKVPIKLIVILWLVTAFLLFLPEESMTKLSLGEFKKDYGKYFGITFIVTSVFLIISIFIWFTERITSRRLKNKYKEIIKEAIENLDSFEKGVLREFYLQGKNTLKVPIDNPTVSGLIEKRILQRVGRHGQMSFVGMLFSHTISETAKKYLTLEILELPTGEPTEEQLEIIREERPQWMLRLEEHPRLFNNL